MFAVANSYHYPKAKKISNHILYTASQTVLIVRQEAVYKKATETFVSVAVRVEIYSPSNILEFCKILNCSYHLACV